MKITSYLEFCLGKISDNQATYPSVETGLWAHEFLNSFSSLAHCILDILVHTRHGHVTKHLKITQGLSYGKYPKILNTWVSDKMAYANSADPGGTVWSGYILFSIPLGILTLLLLSTTCPVLANSVDPDQLASEEANWSGSALFVIKYVNFYQKPGSSNLIGWKLKVGVAS